ncbi:MAG: hypothetical protein EZS28_028860 [Streblomastix strix]|uniref:Uncharacterized protein n=1 Tax=Streblomastix strix TaxID=222440 RepID=A0A5J4UZH1_9EUKA|nr:MAG: hypothetical protein EZS28_028860 [Streblomastix strix]
MLMSIIDPMQPKLQFPINLIIDQGEDFIFTLSSMQSEAFVLLPRKLQTVFVPPLPLKVFRDEIDDPDRPPTSTASDQ